MYCSNCGVQLAEGANFCPSCGTHISSTETTMAAASNTGSVPEGNASQEQKKKIVLWVLGLFSVSIMWALLVNTATVGPNTGNFFPDQIVTALGMVLLPFLSTGAIAGLVYIFKRKPSTAMWTWTVLLLVAGLFLSVGAARMARGTAHIKPLDFFGFSDPSSTVKKLRTEESFKIGLAAYEHGDVAKALRLLGPLVEQGHAGAQSLLGGLYERGNGVPLDYTRAVKWYRKAAEQGHAPAQLFLGIFIRTR